MRCLIIPSLALIILNAPAFSQESSQQNRVAIMGKHGAVQAPQAINSETDLSNMPTIAEMKDPTKPWGLNLKVVQEAIKIARSNTLGDHITNSIKNYPSTKPVIALREQKGREAVETVLREYAGLVDRNQVEKLYDKGVRLGEAFGKKSYLERTAPKNLLRLQKAKFSLRFAEKKVQRLKKSLISRAAKSSAGRSMAGFERSLGAVSDAGKNYGILHSAHQSVAVRLMSELGLTMDQIEAIPPIKEWEQYY